MVLRQSFLFCLLYSWGTSVWVPFSWAASTAAKKKSSSGQITAAAVALRLVKLAFGTVLLDMGDGAGATAGAVIAGCDSPSCAKPAHNSLYYITLFLLQDKGFGELISRKYRTHGCRLHRT